MILEKEFVFLKMTSNEIEKKKFISLIKATAVMRKKTFHQKLESYRFKLPLKKDGLTGSVQGKTKFHNLKNVLF